MLPFHRLDRCLRLRGNVFWRLCDEETEHWIHFWLSMSCLFRLASVTFCIRLMYLDCMFIGVWSLGCEEIWGDASLWISFWCFSWVNGSCYFSTLRDLRYVWRTRCHSWFSFSFSMSTLRQGEYSKVQVCSIGFPTDSMFKFIAWGLEASK